MAAKSSVLSINAGSSSVKASIISSIGDDQYEHVAVCVAERLGTEQAVLHIIIIDEGDNEQTKQVPNASHEQAVKEIFHALQSRNLLNDIVAVGHRVVHGGTEFDDSVRIDDDILAKIEAFSKLAPLHNPHNVAAIRACSSELMKDEVPHFAVFDTSFHSTIPAKAATYPLPAEYRRAGIQKYGFHGTSVKYIVARAEKILQKLRSPNDDKDQSSSLSASFNLIVCHLGNGASVTAVNNGKSVETSMGFTPASGLMMGTRAGSVDPAIFAFAVDHLDNKSVEDVLTDLNKKSGLKAMTGDSDMRNVLEKGKSDNANAKLAVDMFVYSVAQHIASSAVALPGKLDAIVFTAGIGEHSAAIRQKCVEQLQHLFPAMQLDSERNQKNGADSDGVLSPDGASSPVLLDIATDEEIMIARDCMRLLKG